jgi:hypothetical protein
MSLIAQGAGLGLALYAVVVLAAWLGQRHLMYVPDRTRVAPAAIGLAGVSEIELATPDGAQLVAWRSAAAPGRPTLLYFHGNAGNLAGRADRLARYRRQGFGVLMMSWRGYSGGTGRPSEANNVADARLAYERLLAEGVPAQQIVLYGESLGSGVAVQLAAEREVGAVVLDAPYTSIVDVALRTYPYLPVRPLLADRYESNQFIGQVRAPVLILHGERDAVIPASMGRALFAAAPGPKQLMLFPDGGHVDLDEHGATEAVGRWIGEVVGNRVGGR